VVAGSLNSWSRASKPISRALKLFIFRIAFSLHFLLQEQAILFYDK